MSNVLWIMFCGQGIYSVCDYHFMKTCIINIFPIMIVHFMRTVPRNMLSIIYQVIKKEQNIFVAYGILKC